MTERDYEYLRHKLLKLTGIDLHDYKAHQMRRRLDSFIKQQSDSFAVYCKLIERDDQALDKLTKFMTINVSEFFRDAGQFTALETKVLPQLLKQSRELKIWSAGCSNGSEPYSLAILLERLSSSHGHRILGSDIDADILDRAANGGPYSRLDLRNVQRDILSKYFVKSDDTYQVVDRIRQQVNFRRHNLLRDRFERGFDLILCRNVTIYFTEEAKAKLFENFARSLKDGGIIFIGATETLLEGSAYGLTRIHDAFYQKGGSVVAVPSIRKVAALPAA